MLINLGLQKSKAEPGDSALKRITNIAGDMWKREGSFVHARQSSLADHARLTRRPT